MTQNNDTTYYIFYNITYLYSPLILSLLIHTHLVYSFSVPSCGYGPTFMHPLLVDLDSVHHLLIITILKTLLCVPYPAQAPGTQREICKIPAFDIIKSFPVEMPRLRNPTGYASGWLDL
jgi:hypothetical protein